MNQSERFEVRSNSGMKVTGLITSAGQVDKPILVCLPGGSQNANYFDVPNYSFLDTAVANGFTAIALDRPGYGGSDPLPEGHVTYARNAEVLDEIIGTLWTDHGESRPGIVLVSHSIGSAISVHIAARHPEWPLRGMALQGVNVLSPDPVIDAWKSMPPGEPVTFTPEMRRTYTYGPDGTFDPEIIEASAKGVNPCPLDELLEIVGGWLQDAPGLAAQVDVPVHYVLAEYESLWLTGPARVAAFADLFTSAPRVDAMSMDGVGHNIDHHYLGQALHLQQLAFALTCVAPDHTRV